MLQSKAESTLTVDPMLPRPARVLRRIPETTDIVTLELEVEGGPLKFAPGQFTMVYLPGIGEVPLSITGDPDQPELLVHTVRDVGPVTAAICRLQVGDQVGVRGPFGSEWPVRNAQGADVMIIAGGLGLAPVRPIIFQLLANRLDYGSISLLYGTRTPEDMFYQQDLAEWRASFDIDVPVTVDVADSGWHGRVGVVTHLIDIAQFMPDQTWAFICGPEIMMRLSAEELLRRDVPPGQIFLSLERNMKCAVGFCGHCQLADSFICKDGPVLPLPRVRRWLGIREL